MAMHRHTTYLFIVATAALLVAIPVCGAQAASYPVAMADRPLTLYAGMAYFGMDAGIGLSKDRVGKDMNINVSLGFALSNRVEMGLLVEAVDLRYDEIEDHAAFGGFEVYLLGSFIDQFGLRVAFYLPGSRAMINNLESFPGPDGETWFDADRASKLMVGVEVETPFTVTVLPGYLAVRGGMTVNCGFVDASALKQGGVMPQIVLGGSIGVIGNPLPELFLGLRLEPYGLVRPMDGALKDRFHMPFSFTVGGALAAGRLDLSGSWRILDIRSASPLDINAFSVAMLVRF